MNIKQILMNQIKMKNPQMFNQLEQMMATQNPQDILMQTMSKYTPEQKQQFIKYANNFGISNDQLKQYGINS